MKVFNKLLISIFITILALIIAPSIIQNLGLSNTVHAANIRINKTSKVIYEGNSYKLKVLGTKKKVKWSSSDKAIAKVNSKGQVTAKNCGTTTITAKVGKKKFNCRIKVKLLQFDTTFYTLESASKSYARGANISDHKSFYYDLDNDGKKEKITLKIKFYDEDTEEAYEETTDFIFEVNDKVFYKYRAGYEYPTANLYIADLDRNDKTLEIITWDTGDDIDTSDYRIWSKDGSQMKQIGYLHGTDLRIDKKGKIICQYETLPFSPKVYTKYYLFKNSTIKEKKLNLNKLKNTTFTLNYSKELQGLRSVDACFTKKAKNLNTFNTLHNKKGYGYNKSLRKANLQKLTGKKVRFKIIDFKDYGTTAFPKMYIKLSNGKKGYICIPKVDGLVLFNL